MHYGNLQLVLKSLAKIQESAGKIIFIILFLDFFFRGITAQTVPEDTLRNGTDKIRIDSIEIVGNETTENFIILRELTFKEGDLITQKELDYNRERVYSLGLFNKVNFYFFENTLTIMVEESWYIYPIPFFYWRENTLAKSTYGISLLYKNFRGRNETINALAAFGYDPNYMLSYYNPVISEKLNLSFSFGIYYSNFVNKSRQAELSYGKSFSYKSYGGFVGFGKRFNQFNDVFLLAGFSYVEAPALIKGFNAAKGRIDRSPSLTVQYLFDNRDLKQFSKEGLYTKVEYTHKGFYVNNIDYNILSIDFREYRNLLNTFTVRWRLASRFTFGKKIPIYDYSFLGIGEYIRGYLTKDREGHNMMLGSLELAYPILDEWHLKLDLPLLPESLTSTRIGININLFVDTGTTFNNREKLGYKNFDTGFGVGLTILFLPFNAVRFEYAFNESLIGEFIVGTGFAF